jgi:hypothetical protein
VSSIERDAGSRGYCAANRDNTRRQAGDRDEAFCARHSATRPPPGSTPAHKVRTSAAHAERITNTISRGRIVRSAMVLAARGAPAGEAPDAELAASPAGPLSVPAAAPPAAATTAVWQADETLALFFSRHRRAAAPPVGTPAHTFA